MMVIFFVPTLDMTFFRRSNFDLLCIKLRKNTKDYFFQPKRIYFIVGNISDQKLAIECFLISVSIQVALMPLYIVQSATAAFENHPIDDLTFF